MFSPLTLYTLLVMGKEKSVQSLLMLPDHPLGAALQRANALRRCNQEFQKILPKHLINKVNILNVREHCVIVGVCNASLMTQLHFEANVLLDEIKRLPGMQLAESIQFKVITSPSNRGVLNNDNSIPSPDSADATAETAVVAKKPVTIQGKNSAKRSRVTAYASKVLREAASEVKDPSLQSALLKISKKAQ